MTKRQERVRCNKPCYLTQMNTPNTLIRLISLGFVILVVIYGCMPTAERIIDLLNLQQSQSWSTIVRLATFLLFLILTAFAAERLFEKKNTIYAFQIDDPCYTGKEVQFRVAGIYDDGKSGAKKIVAYTVLDSGCIPIFSLFYTDLQIGTEGLGIITSDGNDSTLYYALQIIDIYAKVE